MTRTENITEKKFAAKVASNLETQVSPKCFICSGSKATLSKPTLGKAVVQCRIPNKCHHRKISISLTEIDKADDVLLSIMPKVVTEQCHLRKVFSS